MPRVLIDLTNNSRQNYNLGVLALNSTLQEAAQMKANDMAGRSYFAHNSPDGLTPWHWFGQAGYEFLYAGENLAIHFSDSGDVVAAWMNSPGHRANILNDKFSEIGIATSRGFYQGRETVFVVQMFGHPKPSRIIPPVATLALSDQGQNEGPEVGGLASEISQDPISAEEELVEIFSEGGEEESFVAVQVLDIGNSVDSADFASEVRSDTSADYSKLWEKLVLNPSFVLTVIYVILGAIVFFLVVLALLIEVNKKHWHHVVYGLVLLALILILYLAYKISLNRVEVLADFITLLF